MSEETTKPAPSLSELPDDELHKYAGDLGLDLEAGVVRPVVLDDQLDVSHFWSLEAAVARDGPVRHEAPRQWWASRGGLWASVRR